MDYKTDLDFIDYFLIALSTFIVNLFVAIIASVFVTMLCFSSLINNLGSQLDPVAIYFLLSYSCQGFKVNFATYLTLNLVEGWMRC